MSILTKAIEIANEHGLDLEESPDIRDRWSTDMLTTVRRAYELSQALIDAGIRASVNTEGDYAHVHVDLDEELDEMRAEADFETTRVM